jgi:predicted amidohydrolase YtcJ
MTGPANNNMNFADIIFTGGDIITVDDKNPEADALAICNGKIAAVGKQSEVWPLKGKQTTLIDLKGKTLMPGLIEPHSHPILSAYYYDWIDISGFNNPDPRMVMEKLRLAALEKKPGEWVTAFGYDPILTRGLKALTADLLSEIVPDNPVFIMTQTMHTNYVNHKAFALAGVTRDTPQPGHGSFYVKDENGNLTGMLIETAACLPFYMVMPQKTPEQSQKLILAQLLRYARAGYTTVGAAGFFPILPNAVEIVEKAVKSENVPLRMRVYNILQEMERDPSRKPGTGDDKYRSIGVKFWYDGSPYTGTMLVDDPYLESKLMQESLGLPKNNRGQQVLTQDELRNYIRKYHNDGWQIAVHTQGDRAVREVIDIYEEVISASPRKDLRHRLEHCALFPFDQIERAARLGLTPSWHINHIYYYGEALQDEIIGPKRAAGLMPIGMALQYGHRNSLHNDSPMYPPEPFKLLRTAVTRKTKHNAVIGPDQAISVKEGIKALTLHGAWQLFMEDTVGSLEVGKLADLTILSENPLKVDPDHLDQIRALETYREGKAAGLQHESLSGEPRPGL